MDERQRQHRTSNVEHRTSKSNGDREHFTSMFKVRCSMFDVLSFCLLVLVARIARAHDPLLDLPAPTSVPEAWNVITPSVANIADGLETRQRQVEPYHVATLSP